MAIVKTQFPAGIGAALSYFDSIASVSMSGSGNDLNGTSVANLLDRRLAYNWQHSLPLNGAVTLTLAPKSGLLAPNFGNTLMVAFIANNLSSNAMTIIVKDSNNNSSGTLYPYAPASTAQSIASGVSSIPTNCFYLWPYATIPSTITLQAGAAVNSFSIGRLWVGPILSIPGGVEDTWKQEIVDPSIIYAARTGQVYKDPRPTTRKVSAAIVQQSNIVAYDYPGGVNGTWQQSLQEAGFVAGKGSEFIFLPRTADVNDLHLLGVYGFLTQDLVLQSETGGYYGTQIEIQESR